jgi:hypothetical protein
MSEMIEGFNVTVRGQFYRASGRNRTVGVFGPVTFFLPPTVTIPNGKKKIKYKIDGQEVFRHEQQFKRESILTPNVALYVVQRRLLPTWLAENHPDSVRARTCSIIPGGIKKAIRPAADAVGLDKPVKDMSLQELEAFCKLKGIILDLTAFTRSENGEPNEAREAVQYELDVLTENKRTAKAGENGTEPPAGTDEDDDPEEEEGADMLG